MRSLPGLGDFLCWVPTLRAIRVAFPEAQIHWVGLSQTRYLMFRFKEYLDHFEAFPGYPGIPEIPFSAPQTIHFLAQIQAQQFDWALQMHGSGLWINSFLLLLGAQRNAGFCPPSQPCADGEFFPYPEQEPEVWRNLRLLERLGIPMRGDRLEFPLLPADWQQLERLLLSFTDFPASFVCIHPGASTSDRRWSPENFAVVGDAIAAQGFSVVLTGTAGEAEITQAVKEAMHHPVLDLTGKTDLGTLAALLKKSRLLICNDTGVSHLADALDVDSVVIFSNSDADRWGALRRDRHRVILSNADTPATIHSVLTEAFGLLQREVVCAT